MRRLQLGLLIGLSVAIGLYAVVAYGLFPLGDLTHPSMSASFLANRAALYTHVFASSVAILAGPFQFLRSIRRRRGVHRLLGRAYVIGIGLGALSGLWLSFSATGGLLARSGFAMLSLVWLFTTFRAVRAILARRIGEHRNWMMRSYALTFAAVTLRIQLGIFYGAFGLEFLDVYQWLGWTAWVPNLIVAELLIRRRRSPKVEQPMPGEQLTEASA